MIAGDGWVIHSLTEAMCVHYYAELETEGLFQEAAPKKEIKELVKRIEAKQDIEWNKIKNPHTVSCTHFSRLIIVHRG